MPPYFYRSRQEIHVMCGADLSDLDEEVLNGKEDNTRKRTCQDKCKEKKP
jgi:hypothetical protein